MAPGGSVMGWMKSAQLRFCASMATLFSHQQLMALPALTEPSSATAYMVLAEVVIFRLIVYLYQFRVHLVKMQVLLLARLIFIN